MRRAALVLAVLFCCAAPAAAAPPTWDGPAFHPYTLDPANLDCIGWSDTVIGTTRDCDPVNLVFPGQPLGAVLARLHAAGWVDVTGATQWLYAGSALTAVQAQVAQADGPDPTQRYHMRLWELAPGLTVANVHHEHGSPHRIDMSWDEAESFAAVGVCAAWCQHVHLSAADPIQGPSGLWRGFANDGDATVVPVSPPPPPPARQAPPPAKPAAKKHRKHRPHKPPPGR
jgi:hypothetical protein